MPRALRSRLSQIALAFLRHFPRLRIAVRKAYWSLRERNYRKLAQAIPVDAQTVFFESYGGRSYACSPKAIFEALCEDKRFSDWRFIWSLRAEAAEAAVRENPLLAMRARIVAQGSAEHLKACATAGYWIVNNRVAEWIYPKDGQTYVQCWHGTPLKRLGFDVRIQTNAALNTTSELAWRFGLDAQKWSYLLAPSPFTSEHLASAFGLKPAARAQLIIEEGYPRNDRISTTLASPRRDEEIRTLKQRLDIPPDRKVLLYTPTWRDSDYQSGVGYVAKGLLDLQQMKEALGSDWVVLLRLHYYIANQLATGELKGFAYDVCAVQDINDLYLIADALLTDYSSTVFDYANTNRPLIYYWPDFKEYAEQVRGFYFDPTTLPGDQCTTTEGVIQALCALPTWHERHATAYQAFRQRFCSKDDGQASPRVIAQIFAHVNPACPHARMASNNPKA
ncbi:MAG: CDP-glycerol glycerophosphotransferase family protein [Coriobacteriales bacterium]|nr:CDP-glycerol glycerophosphotransferase family protein [Coriobacteriales bacterium]